MLELTPLGRICGGHRSERASTPRDGSDQPVRLTAEGLVSLVPALAIMLGTNVGTTLIVQILSFNTTSVAQVLFILGLVAFRGGTRSRIKDIDHISIGLGQMLLKAP